MVAGRASVRLLGSVVCDEEGSMSADSVGAAERPSLQQLFDGIYGRLRELSGALMNRQRVDHTLQPTAIVHEAFLKLADRDPSEFKDETHFMATAATVLRTVLIDHARKKGSKKRGGKGAHFSVEPWDLIDTSAGLRGVIDLEDSLRRLAEADARAAKVAEMRIFGNMEPETIAGFLEVSIPTVTRDWRFAKAFLERQYGFERTEPTADSATDRSEEAEATP
ncbi:MAG: RNA polymerase subunit sigma-70 [Planctomycetes bacterium]|nr:RNA polymerase subunit sigma-70 [Planctomycetota bacterium]